MPSAGVMLNQYGHLFRDEPAHLAERLELLASCWCLLAGHIGC
jgi:hypothetical protein